MVPVGFDAGNVGRLATLRGVAPAVGVNDVACTLIPQKNVRHPTCSVGLADWKAMSTECALNLKTMVKNDTEYLGKIPVFIFRHDFKINVSIIYYSIHKCFVIWANYSTNVSICLCLRKNFISTHLKSRLSFSLLKSFK